MDNYDLLILLFKAILSLILEVGQITFIVIYKTARYLQTKEGLVQVLRLAIPMSALFNARKYANEDKPVVSPEYHYFWLGSYWLGHGIALGLVGLWDDDWDPRRSFGADAPEINQLYLSDPATTYMEGLLNFNKHLTFVIVAIIVVVGWLLFSTVSNHDEFYNAERKTFFHSNILEITWTSLPALTLLCLAPSSFALLYSLDEVVAPKISVKIIGHQWFWSYEVSDFDFLLSCLGRDKTIKYTCYMLSTETIIEKNYWGFLRLLETNKRLLLPSNTQIRLLLTSVDVLHSWTIPSFGIKVDACPGRLNQINIFLKRTGLFFGQCSEICGVNHGFMPIALFVTPSTQYEVLVSSKLA